MGEVISFDKKRNELISDKKIRDIIADVSDKGVENIRRVGIGKMEDIKKAFDEKYEYLKEIKIDKLPEMDKEEAIEYLKTIDVENIGKESPQRLLSAIKSILPRE